MTFNEFAEVFAVLALQLRANDTSETTARAYYQILKDREFTLVQLAALDFARTGDFFPKTSEWLDKTYRVYFDRRDKLEIYLRELHKQGKELCSLCSDTGWKRDEATNTVTECACEELRHQEIIGRRALPEHVIP